MAAPISLEAWKAALESLEQDHTKHGCLPRHIVAAVAAEIDRSPETLERRYWRDLSLRGLRRVHRFDESILQLISVARDMPDAYRTAVDAGLGLDYRAFEHSAMSTPGLRLGPLLRREEARRRQIDLEPCPICLAGAAPAISREEFR